jgi:alkanesulfonate monooxygenase SsuD/methylene tetrahydromethanopterin reductase-like flavin-dependent oxidoreductase (luciferase family)
MQFACSLSEVDVDPTAWSRQREAEGWDALFVSDHLWTDVGASPHLWTLLGAMAVSTTRVQLGPAFQNNLFRHPVEFVQASLTMQRISGGRFEAGLGAGWSGVELERTGRSLPSPGERAGRLIEAVEIARQLFDDGRCRFAGRYYQVDMDLVERPAGGPPPLVVSAGGPRVIRAVAPLVDRLELKAASLATRGGRLDLEALATVTMDDLRRQVDLARSTRAELPLGMHVLCRARDDESTRRIAAHFPPGSLFGRFYGPPDSVAEAIRSLDDLGLQRVHVTPGDQQSFANLAPLICGPHTVALDS